MVERKLDIQTLKYVHAYVTIKCRDFEEFARDAKTAESKSDEDYWEANVRALNLVTNFLTAMIHEQQEQV